MSRRDALKFAAALTAGGAAPLAVTPARAAALLDAPLDPGPFPPRSGPWGADAYDPVGFAEALDSLDIPELIDHIAPDDMAAYKRLRGAVLRELPILRHAPFDHPWHKLDETALGLWCAAWAAGVRAGAQYEHLRLALLGPRRVCPRCQGVGSLEGAQPAHDDAGGPEVCPDCGGTGITPTPVPAM